MMKVGIAAVLLLATMANAQGVTYTDQWLANNDTLAGARGTADYPGSLGNGTCELIFPAPVFWFHCENCDIVPQSSSSAEGRYALSTPEAWEDTGSFQFVINFLGAPFNASEITFQCQTTVNEISVYSFPANTGQQEARSRIFDRLKPPADSYLISFPGPVANFTVDAPNVAIGSGSFYTISNIQPNQMEIWFQFMYLDTWFSAAEVDVVRQQPAILDGEEN